MSFILDALKKSDQQRQRSATPTLTTAQIPAEEAKQPALFWYGLLATVLLGAGILIGWMHQSPSEPTTPAIQPSVSRAPELGAQKFVPAPLPAVPETARTPEKQSPPRESLAAAAATPAPADTQRETPAKPATSIQAATVAPVPAAPPPKQEEHVNKVAGDAAKEPEVMSMAELPPTIQQELPKLAVLAHSYSSKPKTRFVFINDRMLHEEEYPVPGLKLEQITPDGMIFSYKGYRFRRGANQ